MSDLPRNKHGEIDFGFRPTTADELQACLADPMWRVCSGALYKIILKAADDDSDSLVVPFHPNRAQIRFLRRLWHRNVILKARQLGFTTLIAILWLDHALFNSNNRCGIIAQDREAAEVIFRDKVKFAYENLPAELKAAMPLARDSASELLFGHNNSSIRVATSMRSGTIHRLHVSEFGKICAKFPEKAREVVTGSIPAVPLDCILVIESTGEGRDGEFYKIVQKAGAMADAGKELTKRDYRLHFYAWFDEPGYRMDPAGVVIGEKLAAYFDAVEAKAGVTLDAEQRAWYAATLEADFSGDTEKMLQEYPSTRDEPFLVSTEGCYYTQQMAALRKSGRLVTSLPVLPGSPCWTFWDIGNTDGTAIWVMQRLGHEFRCIRFYESWGETYNHAVQWLQGLGLVWDRMYLPHDADHVRQGQTTNKSPKQMLEELMPGVRFETVPRIQDVSWGISQTRDIFPMLLIDETHCQAGVVHLDGYKKKWSARLGSWTDEPEKGDGHSEAADALRQFAQAYAGGLLNLGGVARRERSRPNWKRS